MSKKVIDFTVDNISNIILKRPRETPRHSEQNPEYISEIWYLDKESNKLYSPIFQTPRLRVKYGCREWGESSWSYCIGLYNYDIDPEVQKFHEAVKTYDRHVISFWTSHKRDWGHNKIKAKYLTALRRKERTDDPHMILKLITDNDGKVLTSINSKDQRGLDPKAIKYGCYTDQFISPSFVLFNSSGIRPFWQAHQVVVSDMDKVFLEDCLLDVLQPAPKPPAAPPMPMPMPYYTHIPPPPSSAQAQAPTQTQTQTQTQKQAQGLFGRIKKEELLSALGSLKSTKPSKIPKGDRNKITPEDLQKQHSIIKDKVKRTIMLDSVKDMPIEGEDP